MDSNQTIQLRPVYQHPQLNGLYNATPVLSATMPTLSITPSSLGIVGSASSGNNSCIGQATLVNNKSPDDNNPDLSSLTTAILPGCVTSANHAQFVPVNNVNNVCLNNIQLHPIQMPKNVFSTNHPLQTTANQLASSGQLQLQHYQLQQHNQIQNQHLIHQQQSCGQLFQIQISGTALNQNGLMTTTESIDISRANTMTNGQSMEKNNLVPDTNSSLSNGSSSATSFTVSESSTNNNLDLTNKITTGSLINSRLLEHDPLSTSSSSSSITDNHQANIIGATECQKNSILATESVNNNNDSDCLSNNIKNSSIKLDNNNSTINDDSVAIINGNFDPNMISESSTPTTSNNDNPIFIDTANNNSKVVCGSRGFKCHVCHRNFTQKGNLKTHLMTHSGERPYECHVCKKNFTQKGNLDTHVKIHTETKDHKCQYCDKGFTQRGNLKTHVRSIHTKEKPHSCGQCGKSFSQRGNMLTHYKTHDKETRFPCNVCGKTFSQKGNLKTHQQRHDRGANK